MLAAHAQGNMYHVSAQQIGQLMQVLTMYYHMLNTSRIVLMLLVKSARNNQQLISDSVKGEAISLTVNTDCAVAYVQCQDYLVAHALLVSISACAINMRVHFCERQASAAAFCVLLSSGGIALRGVLTCYMSHVSV